jgi:hypothetical protein
MESITAATSTLHTLAAERWAHPTTFAPVNDTGDPSFAALVAALSLRQLWFLGHA